MSRSDTPDSWDERTSLLTMLQCTRETDAERCRDDESPDQEFIDGASAPLAEVLEGYAAQARRTDAIIAQHDLDDRSALPLRSGFRPTLRRVVLHLIEENARHNGHLDILRERADEVTGG